MAMNKSPSFSLYIVDNNSERVQHTITVSDPLKLFKYTKGERATLFICVSCDQWHVVAIAKYKS